MGSACPTPIIAGCASCMCACLMPECRPVQWLAACSCMHDTWQRAFTYPQGSISESAWLSHLTSWWHKVLSVLDPLQVLCMHHLHRPSPANCRHP